MNSFKRRVQKLLEERQQNENEKGVERAHVFRLQKAAHVQSLSLQDPNAALLVIEHPEERHDHDELECSEEVHGCFNLGL